MGYGFYLICKTHNIYVENIYAVRMLWGDDVALRTRGHNSSVLPNFSFCTFILRLAYDTILILRTSSLEINKIRKIRYLNDFLT